MVWLHAVARPAALPLRGSGQLRALVCLAVSVAMTLPVAAFGQSTQSREAAWLVGGHANTYWSMQDSIDQGLSLKVTGKDWHSHQIDLRSRNRQTLRDQMALIHAGGGTLCSDAQGASDWAALRCRAFVSVPPRAVDVECDSRRCVVVQLAPFIARDAELLSAIERTVRSPCDVIPHYGDLQAKYQMREPRGGFSMHTSDVSERWLYCDTSRPVQGHWSHTSKPNVFAVRWSRSASIQNSPTTN